MTRPDDATFELFSRHFEELDHQLEPFAESRGYQLEKNPNRQPCRILRRSGNPEAIIDIYQDDHWRQVDYRPDLPYSIAAAAFYRPPDDPHTLWKLSQMLIEGEPFSVVRDGLQEALTRAATLLDAWNHQVIEARGQRLEVLMYHGGQAI